MRTFRGMLSLYQTELHISTNNPMDVPHICTYTNASTVFGFAGGFVYENVVEFEVGF
jgi:hypothetical protein